MIATVSTFPSDLYRTLFPGYIATQNGEVYLSGEQLGFREIDRLMSLMPANAFGKYTCDHDYPDETEQTAELKKIHFDVGVNPAWATGYKKALDILQKSVLRNPSAFFAGDSRRIEITIIVTHNALISGTKIEQTIGLVEISDLAKKVALFGMRVILRKMSPLNGAAAVHEEFAESEIFGEVKLKMARLWMNLLLQVGGEKAVMFPNNEEYENANDRESGFFAAYLSKVIAWNKKHTVFAD